MRKTLYIIFAVLLFQQFTLGQWLEQSSGSNLTKYNVHFVNENTGWVTGTNSLILKTTNGGNNWVQQIPMPTGRELNGLHMLNANTGYIAGWTSTFLKTTNGGNNWVDITVPSGQYNDVYFVNEQTGWLCAFLGVIRKTTNGGISWDSLNTGNTGPLNDILFVNDQTGWVVGDVGYMRKTTNGGLNWFFQFFGTFSDYYYNSLCFINANTGWVVSYNDKVFKTTNSGINWDSVSSTPGICIFFANSMTGWTGGDNGDLYKTTNGGLNFYLQSIPNPGGFFTDFSFINDSVGWSTKVQRIYHTTNSGGEFVGVNSISNNTPDSYKLFQNYPNPFNTETIINFQILEEKFVRIKIYNVLGQNVETPVNEILKTGKYEFKWDANNKPSGVYFYSLSIDNYTETKKMILNK